jgi:hypothetical protein
MTMDIRHLFEQNAREYTTGIDMMTSSQDGVQNLYADSVTKDILNDIHACVDHSKISWNA